MRKEENINYYILLCCLPVFANRATEIFNRSRKNCVIIAFIFRRSEKVVHEPRNEILSLNVFSDHYELTLWLNITAMSTVNLSIDKNEFLSVIKKLDDQDKLMIYKRIEKEFVLEAVQCTSEINKDK